MKHRVIPVGPDQTLAEYLAQCATELRADAEKQLALWREKMRVWSHPHTYRKARQQVEAWTHHIVQFDAHLERLRPKLEHTYRNSVLKAIRAGALVAERVLVADDTFGKAHTAYERYCKAKVTSFGNRKNAVMFDAAAGYKVKVQSGKPATIEHLDYIAQGMAEVEQALRRTGVGGGMTDVLQAVGLTVAHTDGKQPFLRKAGGLYTVHERTISVGVVIGGRPVRALAHELAHMLDHEAGHALYGTGQTWSTGNNSTCNFEVAQMLSEASIGMTREREARDLFTRRKVPVGADEQVRTTFQRARLGAYWYRTVEIFARLVEQRLSLVLPESQNAFEGNYVGDAAYWTANDIRRWAPVIDQALCEMLATIRARVPIAQALGANLE